MEEKQHEKSNIMPSRPKRHQKNTNQKETSSEEDKEE
jgi:hypothetical protein